MRNESPSGSRKLKESLLIPPKEKKKKKKNTKYVRPAKGIGDLSTNNLVAVNTSRGDTFAT